MSSQSAKSIMNGFYGKTVKFNKLADKDYVFHDQVDFQLALKNQMERVLEEVAETIEGLEENDNVKILDGVVDSLVVVMGALRVLERQGMDVVGAMQAVADNNLSKFSTSYADIYDSQIHYGVDKVYISTVEDNGITYYGLKNIHDDKVRKPLNYVGVDLKPFVGECE